MYARSPGQIREWIRDGSTSTRRQSATWREQRERGNLRMPAFGRGLARAGQLGCTGCHGPGGRLARPNPGSLRGFVPPWDGPDFPELVRDRREFDEWVERGISRRFERNALARYFLERAVLKMPAHRRYLAPGDLDALWGYVTWLRKPRA